MKRLLSLALVGAILSLASCGGNSAKKQAEAWEKEARELMAQPIAIPQPEAETLAQGEVLYKGNASFAQTEGFEVSFILTATGSEIRDLKIAITGLSVTARHGNSEIRVNGASTITTFSQPIPVRNGRVDASLGNNGKLSIVLGSDGTASGSVAYTYVISDNSGSIMDTRRPDIPVDFGTSPISFRAQ